MPAFSIYLLYFDFLTLGAARNALAAHQASSIHPFRNLALDILARSITHPQNGTRL